MIEYIKKNKIIFAQIIRSKFKSKKGVNFFTKPNLIQQVAYMNHKQGHKIIPHYHKRTVRKINKTSEVLIILNGKLRVDFYSNNEKYLFSKIIKKNDIIILNSGGHGFKVLETVEMIEVKQGPYNIKTDKKVFNSINDKFVKIK